jgi:hypothetical protein
LPRRSTCAAASAAGLNISPPAVHRDRRSGGTQDNDAVNHHQRAIIGAPSYPLIHIGVAFACSFATGATRTGWQSRPFLHRRSIDITSFDVLPDIELCTAT